jgi:hypothetical protein
MSGIEVVMGALGSPMSFMTRDAIAVGIGWPG